MCNHLYEELVPVFDDGGSIECADVTLECSLLDDASFVLRGYAEYAEGYVMQQDGWHRELRWLPQQPVAQVVYDDEIPF